MSCYTTSVIRTLQFLCHWFLVPLFSKNGFKVLLINIWIRRDYNHINIRKGYDLGSPNLLLPGLWLTRSYQLHSHHLSGLDLLPFSSRCWSWPYFFKIFFNNSCLLGGRNSQERKKGSFLVAKVMLNDSNLYCRQDFVISREFHIRALCP